MFSYFGLTQVVSEPTRIRPDETSSMLDLIAISSLNLLQSCATAPPLFNSDHLGLLLHSQWRHYNPPVDNSPRALWMYKHADWTRARELIEVTDWNSLLTDDMNVPWANWKQHFMKLTKECMPHKSLPPRRNLPWLSKNLIQQMRKRNMLYSRAKRSSKKSDFEKYKQMLNRVVSQLRETKSRFFKSINPRDAKKFWKAVKYLNNNAAKFLC